MTTTHADKFVALTGLLTREAELLGTLIFKLTEAELLVNAEQTRFLGLIVDEIEAAAGEVGSIEFARGLMVADIAFSLGLDSDDLPLSALTPHAPAHLHQTLDEVRDRLATALEQLDAVAGRGRSAIGRRLESLDTMMDRLDPVDAKRAYDRHGFHATGASPRPSRVDRPL